MLWAAGEAANMAIGHTVGFIGSGGKVPVFENGVFLYDARGFDGWITFGNVISGPFYGQIDKQYLSSEESLLIEITNWGTSAKYNIRASLYSSTRAVYGSRCIDRWDNRGWLCQRRSPLWGAREILAPSTLSIGVVYENSHYNSFYFIATIINGM